MPTLIGLNDTDPISSDQITQHCNADHDLRAQMLAKGLIHGPVMDKYHLTAKGRQEFARRARARAEAMRMGLVHSNTAAPAEEIPPFEQLTKAERQALGLEKK